MAELYQRKWSREDAADGLRYLYQLYGIAPAAPSHFLYLVQLEHALNPARRLPPPSALYRFWPNVRDAWMDIDINPTYNINDLDTGFVFNDILDTRIQRIYEEFQLRGQRLERLAAISSQHQVPVPALAIRAVQLGLETGGRIEWTEAELKILSSTQHLSKQTISSALAAAGYRRSITAGRIIRARQSQVNSVGASHYSRQQLSQLIGIDSNSVRTWLNKGWLQFEMKGTVRTKQQGGDTYIISRQAVADLARKHPELIDFRKVNQGWFINLLRETETPLPTSPTSI